MLVFSRWGYNHNKLFANALGLHRVKKNKQKKLWWELKWNKQTKKDHDTKKYNKDNKTQNKSYTPD